MGGKTLIFTTIKLRTRPICNLAKAICFGSGRQSCDSNLGTCDTRNLCSGSLSPLDSGLERSVGISRDYRLALELHLNEN